MSTPREETDSVLPSSPMRALRVAKPFLGISGAQRSQSDTDSSATTLQTVPILWRDSLFWLAQLLTLFAIAPFMLPGYFWGANDARHHVYFLFEFDRLVQDGIWWPRWSPDFAFGYGYPFFNIYGPLSHFVAEVLLHVSKLNHTDAIEVVFGLGIIASAGAMYGYVRSLAGSQAALLASVVYTYVPYHLLVLYVRGNLAEATAFLWLPLCLWSFRETVKRPTLGWFTAAALGYAGLILTSNLVWVLFTPLLLAYILALLIFQTTHISSWRMRLWHIIRSGIAPGLAGILAIGLSANFLVPMVFERHYVRVDQWFDGRYNFRDDFLYLFQLFSPHWGFGVSQPGPDDTIGFQIGAVPLLFASIGLLCAGRVRPLRAEVVIFPIAAVVATAVGLEPFAFLWEWPFVGSVLQAAQFPWRWLPITALCISVLAGFLLLPENTQCTTGPDLQQPRPLTLPLVLTIGVVLLGSFPFLKVDISEPAEGPVSLAALMRFQRDADEMTGSTLWVKEIPTWSPMAEYYVVQLDEAGRPVTPVTSKVDYQSVNYERLAVGSVAHSTVMEEVYFCTDPGPAPGDCGPRTDQRIVFNHFYYPGWRAYLLDEMHGQPLQELPVVPEGCTPVAQHESALDLAVRPCPPFPSYPDTARAIATDTQHSTLGRMVVPVPAVGEGYILLRFEDTPPRIMGKWISLIAFGLLIAAWFTVRLGGLRPQSKR